MGFFAKATVQHHINRATNLLVALQAYYQNKLSDDAIMKKIEQFDLEIEAAERDLKKRKLEFPKTQRIRLLLKYFGKIELKKGKSIKGHIIERNLETLKKKGGKKKYSDDELNKMRTEASFGADSYKNNLNQLGVAVMEYKDALTALLRSM